ncbi:TM2 domain-containing protein [Cytophagaceae bacterium ABcell3]|nr:TM2 domain-containing protein [Cytophagaceae bacterium ABcell3]
MSNSKFFESHHIESIREKLLAASDDKWGAIQAVSLKDPTTMLIVSLVAGQLGIDRFMIGDTGMGIGKLLTCGGFLVWAIVDWFMIQGAAREKNLQKLMKVIG